MSLKKWSCPHLTLVAAMVVAALLLSSAVTLAKKGLSREFNAPKDAVFAAVMRAVAQDYRLSGSDREIGIVSFETGSQTWSWKAFKLDAKITSISENRTRVDLNIRKGSGSMFGWGQAGGIGDKFFERVESELEKGSAGPRTPPAATPSPSPSPSVNPASEAGKEGPNAEGGCNVEIVSTPTSADIELDGAFVGNTPAILKLACGDHKLGMKMAGYKNWERTFRATPGTVRMAATLEKAQP